MMELETSSGGFKIFILFIVWGLLASLQFYARGNDSFIRVHDNGESNHPSAYAAAHHPDLTPGNRWNHFIVCGCPRFTRGSVSLVLQKLFPGQDAFIILMILQRIIAGYSMYLLAWRLLQMGRAAAISVGLLYPFLVTVDPLGIFHSLAEPALPLYILILDFLLTRSALVMQILGGIALGAFFGFASSLFIAQPYLLAGMLVFLIILRKYRLRFLIPVGLAFLIGLVAIDWQTFTATWGVKDGTQRILLSGAQWRPSWGQAFQRTWSQAVSTFKDDIILVIVIAIGIFGGILRNRHFRWLFAMTIFCGLLTYLFPIILAVVTGSHFFRAIQFDRFYILLPFFMMLAAGYAVDKVAPMLQQQQSRGGGKYATWLLIVVTAVAISIAFYLPMRRLQTSMGGSIGWLGTQKAVVLLTLLIIGGIIVITAAIARAKRGGWRMAGYSVLVAALPLAAILMLGDRLASNMLSAERYDRLYLRPEYASIRSQFHDDDPFRVATLFPDVTRSDMIPKTTPLHPMPALMAGLETADGYLSLYPVRYHLYWRKVLEGVRNRVPRIRDYFDNWGQRVYLFGPDWFGGKSDKVAPGELYNLDLLGLANVRYLFSRTPVDDPNLEMVGEGGGDRLYTYRNLKALPRFMLVHDVRVFDDSLKLLDSLSRTNADDLRRMAFIESAHSLSLPDTSAGLATDTVIVNRYESDRMELEVKSERAGIVIATNNWFTGWRATVNGQPAEVQPVDFTFQGVAVHSGKSDVVLWYSR